jgi:hypothetical protein
MVVTDQVDLLILVLCAYNAFTLFSIQQMISAATMGFAISIGPFITALVAIIIALYGQWKIDKRDVNKAKTEIVAKRQQAISELIGCSMLTSAILREYNRVIIHNFGISQRLILEQYYYQLANSEDQAVAMEKVSQT